jgi:acyl-CoA synthetase (AMP-forming)/AMP-acid ligase II
MGALKIAPASRRVMNLGHFLKQSADLYPQQTALAWGERSWSWAASNARVDAAAAALAKLGVGKGDRILVQSRNSNAMFESMFAAFKLGAVWVPVNFRLLPDDVAYIAEASGASLLLYEAKFGAHAEAAVKRAGSLAGVVALDRTRPGERSWESLLAEHAGVTFAAAAVEYDDPCWFFFTSGSTGRPKAAVLTHGQMGFVVTNHIADLMPGLGPQDVSLVVAPLSHGAGIHQLIQVARGTPTVLPVGERFDADEIFRLIERHRVSNVFTVPSIVKLMVEDAAVDRYDHSSLRQVIYAGAPMYRADQRYALGKLGKCLVQYFGLGEVTGNITVLPAHLHDADDTKQGRIGSCGYARTAMQVSIQDDAGRELERGQTGEICVIGPAVFAGYFNNEAANAKSFRNGWFRTGDLGHMDAAGFLYITGRNSDMFISGGSNIYPREIEEKILCHPQVREVAVVGMPDAKWGEIGVAAVVATEPACLTGEDLIGWMKSNIAGYKVPRKVVFFDELPKSGYGKITKTLVRAAIEAREAVQC